MTQPLIPPRTPNRWFDERTSETLEQERSELDFYIRRAVRNMHVQKGLFYARSWSQAAEYERLVADRTRVEKGISLHKFGGSETEWERREESRWLLEQVQARLCHMRIYEERSERQRLREKQNGRRSLRANFMKKSFQTSEIELLVHTSGARKKDRTAESQFRTELIDSYNFRKPDSEDGVWCPILGMWNDAGGSVAVQFFPWIHGQDTMTATFGKTKSPELFSPRNGLIVSRPFAKEFDSGKMVIVPHLPEKPTRDQILSWLKREPREYKIRIIDSRWDKLDRQVSAYHTLTWRELDNKVLEFRNNFRPRAQYLYFHYCVQLLRRAWRYGPGQDAPFLLQNELDHLYWGRKAGRNLPHNMLRAFVEELGAQKYGALLKGARRSSGDSYLLLHTAAAQVKATRRPDDELFKDSEESDSDDEEDREGRLNQNINPSRSHQLRIRISRTLTLTINITKERKGK
jgi:hypothetical protein